MVPSQTKTAVIINDKLTARNISTDMSSLIRGKLKNLSPMKRAKVTVRCLELFGAHRLKSLSLGSRANTKKEREDLVIRTMPSEQCFAKRAS